MSSLDRSQSDTMSTDHLVSTPTCDIPPLLFSHPSRSSDRHRVSPLRQRRLSWSCFADFPRGVITVSATITAALIQLRFNGGGCSNCLFQDGGVVSRDQGCCVATATPRYDPTERHSSRDWRDRLMPTGSGRPRPFSRT